MNHFQYIDGILHAENVPVPAIAEAVGTPFYCYSTATLERHYTVFANAFGAVATAYALTGSSLSIVPILLFAQIRGDVLQDPHLGYALAFGMIVVTAIANAIYIIMRTRAERWIK